MPMREWFIVSWLLFSASAFAGQSCVAVRGAINIEYAHSACASTYGTCTHGSIAGDSLLTGSTEYSLEQVSGVAGDPNGEAVFSYKGTLVVTTKEGTLTITEVGVFDPGTGVISSQTPTIVGAGQFAGATGLLFLTGTGTQPGYDAQVSGNLCIGADNPSIASMAPIPSSLVH